MKDFGGSDLMMNMVGTLVVMLAVFMPLVQLEQLTYLDNSTPQVSTDTSSPESIELAMVEISMSKDSDTPVFRWRPSGTTELQNVASYKDLKAQFEMDRPNAIRLRMDRSVPSGIMQDLVIDTSRLGISIYQSNRKG